MLYLLTRKIDSRVRMLHLLSVDYKNNCETEGRFSSQSGKKVLPPFLKKQETVLELFSMKYQALLSLKLQWFMKNGIIKLSAFYSS